MNIDNEIFTIKARRCKRCGGLLTSEKAIKEGFGHSCKMKLIAEREATKFNENQITFFEKE